MRRENGAHDEAVPGQALLGVGQGDLADRHPGDVAQRVDARRGVGQRLEAVARRPRGGRRGRPGGRGTRAARCRDASESSGMPRDHRRSRATNSAGRQAASGGRRAARSVHGQRVDRAQRVEADGAQAAGDRAPSSMPCGGIITRSTGRPQRRSKRSTRRSAWPAIASARGLAARAQQLALDVVVAVDDEREAVAARAEERGRRPVRAARVERDHRHRRVVAVRVGVVEQAAVVDEAVAPPAQVRVVEDEGGAQRRRRPARVARQPAQEAAAARRRRSRARESSA